MSREEFFLLQARHVDTLIRHDRLQTEHGEYLLAQIAAAVINSGMLRPKELVKVDDLMPSRRKPQSAPRYQGRERVATNVAQIFGAFVQKS